MSGIAEKTKEVAGNLLSKVRSGSTGEDETASGEFPKPDAFPEETQRGEIVGKQHLMEKEPESVMFEGTKDYREYRPAGKLVGKKAIITGGDSGIGRAVAVQFSMEGAEVAIIYLPEEEKDAQETSDLCFRYSGRNCAATVAQDISDEAGITKAIEQIVTTKFASRLDILVNNASVMYDTENLEDITTQQFDRTIKSNVYGMFFVTRAALKYIPKGGSIINTVSQVAYSGSPSLLDYSMSKGAGVAFTRSLSQNLLSKGIRVNGVAPGPVWTPLQPAAMSKEKLKQWHSSPAPIGRIGQPVECGPAYVLLASKDGSFFNGQVLHPNGGKVVNG